MHSEKYLKELQRLHSRKGFGVAKNIPQGVQKLIADKGLQSILDFGCGKGMPFKQLEESNQVYNYDPVTSPIDLPKKADLVYSSDVLEHIEPDQLEGVLNNLYSWISNFIPKKTEWIARNIADKIPKVLNLKFLLLEYKLFTNLLLLFQ